MLDTETKADKSKSMNQRLRGLKCWSRLTLTGAAAMTSGERWQRPEAEKRIFVVETGSGYRRLRSNMNFN